MANWKSPAKWIAGILSGGLSFGTDALFEGITGKDPWTEGFGGIDSYWNSLTGQGSNWDKKQFEEQQDWAWRNFDRDEDWRNEDLARSQQWRDEDIARQTKWRNEDIERDSLTHRMGELKAAGLHPMLAAGGMGGGGGGQMPATQNAPMTSSGGRVPRPVASTPAQMSPVEMAQLYNQSQNDRAQRALIGAEARKTTAEAMNIEYENTDLQRKRREGTRSAEESKTRKEIENIESIIKSAVHTDKLTEEQTKFLATQLSDLKYELGFKRLYGKDENGPIIGVLVNTFKKLVAGIGAKLTDEEIENIIMSMYRD